MENLNTCVKHFSIGDRIYEIDRLEDTKDFNGKGTFVYHLFELDGSEHGKNVGGDFISVGDAMEYAKEFDVFAE